MCKLKWTLIAVIAFISFLGYQTKAAEIYYDSDKNWIEYTGDTVEGDLERLIKAVEEAEKDDWWLSTINLQGPGGDAYTMFQLSEYVRENELSTIVLAGNDCYSSCALVWAAGYTRYFTPGAVIGFHWPFSPLEQLVEIQRDYGLNGVRDLLTRRTIYLQGEILKNLPHVDASTYLIKLADTSPFRFWEITEDEAIEIFGAE